MTNRPTYSIDLDAPFQERVERALNDRPLRAAVSRTTTDMSNGRIDKMAEIDGELLRTQTRQMKEYVLRNLPQLLEQFEETLTANGGHVHWARDAAEANAIVQQLAREKKVKTAVKSKSMATEEIHLNQALEALGIPIVETDLGEYIIQLDNEPPSHMVAPVIHKRLEEISQIFQEKLDMPPTYDPATMCAAARGKMRADFMAADMGISGCNFAIAESGSVCICTNEGNGRLTTTLPRIYVAVMGIEKIVPTIEDAFLQYQALCRSATGQRMTVYMSMTNGPRKPDDIDGPEEFHVILLDNGRSDMLAKGYGEALMCIRCGACLNVCPVYREIGGHAYGSPYSGPIGAVINPLLPMHVTDAAELPHASTLCGACKDACPVKIDLPKLLLDLRAAGVQSGDAPFFEKQSIKNFVNAMSTRQKYERAGKMARVATSMMTTFGGGNIQFAPSPLSGWTQSRTLPPFAKRSFREQFKERVKAQRRIAAQKQSNPQEGQKS